MTALEMKAMDDANAIRQLHENGCSTSDIAKLLELNESTVRSVVHVIENPYPWGCGD